MGKLLKIYRGYLFFSVKDRNLFHRLDIIGSFFTSGAATSENITDGVHEMKYFDLSPKKTNILFIPCFQPLLGEVLLKSSAVLFHYSPWRTPLA